ncbi:MAG: hypothetical protein SGPRY_012712 [Prymnesium sp.]
MEDSLHHPAWGYYSEGRVRFGESTGEADFTTFPVSMRPHFGAMLADRLHAFDTSCEGTSPLLLVELGCGTGVLAHDVLTRIKQAHPQLYSRLIYVIGERSAALRAVQQRTNASFIQEGRLRIEAVDARDLHLAQLLRRLHVEQGGAADSPLRAALLSNELPDAFAVEKVLVGVLPPPTQSAPSPLSRWRLQRGRVLPLIRLSELKQIMQLIAAHSGLSPPTGPSLAPWSRMPHRLQMTRYIQSEMPPPFLHRCCLPLSLTPPRLPHILRLPISQMPAISLE